MFLDVAYKGRAGNRDNHPKKKEKKNLVLFYFLFFFIYKEIKRKKVFTILSISFYGKKKIIKPIKINNDKEK